jgi:uncharacterized protein
LEVDVERKRISLTMKKEPTEAVPRSERPPVKPDRNPRQQSPEAQKINGSMANAFAKALKK